MRYFSAFRVRQRRKSARVGIESERGRTGRYLGRTAIPDSSGISGYGAKSFLATNGEGRVVEAGVDSATDAVERPGVAFDNHLRVARV